MKFYALKRVAVFEFVCVSADLDGFKSNIDRAYWNWRSTQGKDQDMSKELFMESYTPVVMTIERYDLEGGE